MGSIIILGAGSNVGLKVAEKFLSSGFKVSTVSRSASLAIKNSNHIHLQGDLSQPQTIPKIFEKAIEFHGVPNVVVYNAAGASFGAPDDVLNDSLDVFTNSLNINTVSVFTSLKEAVKGFNQLPSTTQRVFIYTGNAFSNSPNPRSLTLSLGKASSHQLLRLASLSYGAKGFKFYYADERQENGDAVYLNLSGDAHAEFYYTLATGNAESIPLDATFIKLKGYVKFDK